MKSKIGIYSELTKESTKAKALKLIKTSLYKGCVVERRKEWINKSLNVYKYYWGIFYISYK